MTPMSFQDMYLSELSEMASVEDQMARSLGRFADKATDNDLVDLIRAHRDKTEQHRDRLADLLHAHDADADAHSDRSMAALISETGKWAETIEDGTLRDAGLIASLQRMEHYEMAVLGTLASWAEQLGHKHDATTLAAILEDDKDTDARLTDLAERTVNRAAA